MSYYFEEGVLVQLPPGLGHIVVKQLDLQPFPDSDSHFTYSREVIRIDFETKKGEKQNLKDLKHPFHIIVFFDEYDLRRVGDRVDDLILGIHDGTKWTAFKKPKWDKNKDDEAQKKLTGKWKGYAKIKIKDWKDPAIGWGP